MHRFGKFRAFRRGHPFDSRPSFFDTEEFEHGKEERHTPSRKIVAARIVTVSRVTAAEDDAVGSPLKRAQDKDRVQAARTGNADDFDVGRIFEAIASGQIRSRIRTPVAAKGYDLRFECTSFCV